MADNERYSSLPSFGELAVSSCIWGDSRDFDELVVNTFSQSVRAKKEISIKRIRSHFGQAQEESSCLSDAAAAASNGAAPLPSTEIDGWSEGRHGGFKLG